MIGSRTRTNEVTAIFLIILIVGLFEEHKQQILKGEKLLSVAVIAIAALLVATAAHKVLRDLVKRHQLLNPSMSAIDEMSGLDFEKFVVKLLSSRGYTYVTLTEKYDFGIDIVAEKDGIRCGIQVKRRDGLVKANAVRQVVTALKKYNCSRAMVITNGHYSKVATELARSNSCVLIDRKELYRWFPSRKGEYKKSLRPGLYLAFQAFLPKPYFHRAQSWHNY